MAAHTYIGYIREYPPFLGILLWIPDSRYWISGIWIGDEIVISIPESFSCILDSKAQDPGSHKQKFTH